MKKIIGYRLEIAGNKKSSAYALLDELANEHPKVKESLENLKPSILPLIDSLISIGATDKEIIRILDSIVWKTGNDSLYKNLLKATCDELLIVINFFRSKSIYNWQLIETLPSLLIDKQQGRDILDSLKALPKAIHALHLVGINECNRQLDILLIVAKRTLKSLHGVLQKLPGALECLTVELERDDIESASLVANLLIAIADKTRAHMHYYLDQISLVIRTLQSNGLNIFKMDDETQNIVFKINPLFVGQDSYPEIIHNRLSLMQSTRTDTRPIAIVVYPHVEHNNYFMLQHHVIGQFINNGYKVLFFQTRTKQEFIKVFGTLEDNEKASILMIAGHGNPQSITLGDFLMGDPIRGDYLNITIHDEEFLRLSGVRNHIRSEANVILYSCSTGGSVKDSGDNMAKLFSRVFGVDQARVYAPDSPILAFYPVKLSWDHGELVNVSWEEAT